MPSVSVGTLNEKTAPFWSVNQVPAVSAYPTIDSTLAKLEGRDGFRKMGTGGFATANFGVFHFYGTGTAAQTVNVQLIGWRRTMNPSGSDEWVPHPLADLLVTLGSQTSKVNTANKWASTIAVNGAAVVPNNYIAPTFANCAIARFVCDLEGCEFVSMVIGTGTLTDINGDAAGF